MTSNIEIEQFANDVGKALAAENTQRQADQKKVAPLRRAVERTGHIRCRPILGRLHHQYARIEFAAGADANRLHG